MRELYRHKDHSMVAYYKQLLEAAGIPIMLRNEHLTMTGLSEIPIPEFYPNICVLDDSDYERAWELMRTAIHENAVNSDEEVNCAACDVSNPGNFDLCFACQEPVRPALPDSENIGREAGEEPRSDDR